MRRLATIPTSRRYRRTVDAQCRDALLYTCRLVLALANVITEERSTVIRVCIHKVMEDCWGWNKYSPSTATTTTIATWQISGPHQTGGSYNLIQSGAFPFLLPFCFVDCDCAELIIPCSGSWIFGPADDT